LQVKNLQQRRKYESATPKIDELEGEELLGRTRTILPLHFDHNDNRKSISRCRLVELSALNAALADAA
jgi:hypothetical protein